MRSLGGPGTILVLVLHQYNSITFLDLHGQLNILYMIYNILAKERDPRSLLPVAVELFIIS